MLWDSDSSRLKKHRSTGKVSWQQKQQGPAHSAPCWDLPKRCGGISNNHLSNSLQLAIGKRNRRVQVKYRWSLLPPANERQQSRMVSANIHSGMTPVQLLISPILTQYKVGLSSNIDVHRMFFWVIVTRMSLAAVEGLEAVWTMLVRPLAWIYSGTKMSIRRQKKWIMNKHTKNDQ